jgi:hypothetical protein
MELALAICPPGLRRVRLCTPRLRRRVCLLLGLGSLLAAPARAHIGSPDTFVQAAIGPYTVLIAAHPPAVYPGALELDLRFNPDDRITGITASLDDAAPAAVPLVLDGTASTSLWAATPAAHTVHLTLHGGLGDATYSVALPAAPNAQARFAKRRDLSPVLVGGSCVLLAAAVMLALRRRRWLALGLFAGSAAMLAGAVAAHSASATTTVTATLHAGHLDLNLTNPGESFAGLLPDHGKLMHLFLVREPGKDVFLHLHPRQLAPGHFDAALPAMPPGTYTLFADFYHGDGRGETDALRLTLPQQTHTSTTDADDSSGVVPAITGASASTNGLHTFALHDGYVFQLQTPSQLVPLHANLLTATLLDPNGQPPQDMALYLSMTAHAVVLRTDDQVFAHIHPGGTLPMLMPALADGSMPGMAMPAPSNTATIPYGFPSAGLYRVFVQMKHGRVVETAAFDLDVR